MEKELNKLTDEQLEDVAGGALAKAVSGKSVPTDGKAYPDVSLKNKKTIPKVKLPLKIDVPLKSNTTEKTKTILPL